MRAQGPLHEGHLAEAVRRGVLTVDQLEAVLAIARTGASPEAAHLPDLRWTNVVLGIAASVAVLVPGVTILARSHDLGAGGVLEACTAALACCALFGWLARSRGWGRVPAGILLGAIAPYAGGLLMYLLDQRWHQVLTTGYLYDGYAWRVSYTERQQVFGLLYALGASVCVAVGGALWALRRNGPALMAAGFCAAFLPMCAVQAAWGVNEMRPQTATALVASTVLLAAVTLRKTWMRRDGVDGAAWFELGVFGAAGVVALVRAVDAHEWPLWSLAALATGALGLRMRRWTFQLSGALGLLGFTGLGLHRESMAVIGGALVVASVMIAAAAVWHRRRESARAGTEVAREPLTLWA